MSKEGPQMGRRQFLKTLATGAGAAVLEQSGKAQERPVLDNSNEELIVGNSKIKINYPERPKKITPEAEEVILAIENYQRVFAGGSIIENNSSIAGKQQAFTKIGSEEEIMKERKNVWQKLRELDPSLSEFSVNDFYKILINKVPTYLAEYGIFAFPIFQPMHPLEVNPSTKFIMTEASMIFLDIDRVQHDEVEQWGTKMKLDVVYLKGPTSVRGKVITKDSSVPHAQNAFQNIIMFETAIEDEYKTHLINLKSLRDELEKHPNGELENIFKNNLEQANRTNDAIQLGMIGVLKRLKGIPSLNEFKGEILAHETRHLFDNLNNVYPKEIHFQKTTSVLEYRRHSINKFIHYEINAFIAQLKYSPNKAFCLLRMLINSREDVGNTESLDKCFKWVIGHIVGVVSENPEKYGIEVSKNSKISIPNQILGQLGMLLDNPDLMNSISDRLITIHQNGMNEDFYNKSAEEVYHTPTERKSESSDLLLKLSMPTAIVAGGAAALEYLRRRKNRKKTEQLTAAALPIDRAERRRKEKEENKKGKK